MAKRPDFALCVMPICAVLALCSVTVLAPRHAALAAPPSASKSQMAAYDDGDGDELLEHWGDAKYAREERLQMAGALAGFAVLGVLSWRKRSRRQAAPVELTLMDVSERRKAA